MNVAVIGAGGDIGRGVVDDLKKSGIDVVACDLKEEAVMDMDADETAALDVTADDAGERLASLGVDVAVGTAGPFYALGVPALETAIDAGVDYVDVCDDHDATEDELALSDKAEERDVSAVVGCGWTPGISNLLVADAVDRLVSEGAEVGSVEVDWIGSAADAEGVAVVAHVFHTASGKVPQYVDGERVEVRAGSGAEKVDVPGFGDVKTYASGHPESVTLPASTGAKNVRVHGALVPGWQNSLVRAVSRAGLVSTRSRKDRMARYVHAVEGLFEVGGKQESAVRVRVTDDGEDGDDGEHAVEYAATGRMRVLTGCAASVGAQRIAGDVDEVEAGAHPPEEAFEAAGFLNDVGEREVTFHEKVDGDWATKEGF